MTAAGLSFKYSSLVTFVPFVAVLFLPLTKSKTVGKMKDSTATRLFILLSHQVLSLLRRIEVVKFCRVLY